MDKLTEEQEQDKRRLCEVFGDAVLEVGREWAVVICGKGKSYSSLAVLTEDEESSEVAIGIKGMIDDVIQNGLAGMARTLRANGYVVYGPNKGGN